jgi:tRNA1Val (adenine37-N6)-methyltransferase|tara:strand:- start:4006 stop:4719 length:714 start_codon:yes stop_codon:yes gene_type:complete
VGFKFKQFTIEHDACAMKVGTDSIMLGSWVQTKNAQRILDIGTGSGLLAIMLAQKAQHTCSIDGIDIDALAISQAKDNAKNCPWPEQLTFYHTSLQQFAFGTGYGLIVSNPPYFSINVSANKTHSVKNRLNARQTIELDHPTLLQKVTEHLSASGKFYCVLPSDVAKVFIVDAETVGLYCSRELQVQPKHQTHVTRILLEFSRTKKTKISQKLSIYNHLGSYSKEYMALCKDYYLNF